MYLMGDLSLMQNRLRIVAGARYERTTDNGHGVLQDNQAKFQHDASGKLILDAQKRPILIPAVATDLIAQDALVFKRLGARMHKRYGDYYPSINASYNFTENMIGRLGLSRTLGRPEFTNLVGPSNVTQNNSIRPRTPRARRSARSSPRIPASSRGPRTASISAWNITQKTAATSPWDFSASRSKTSSPAHVSGDGGVSRGNQAAARLRGLPESPRRSTAPTSYM